MSNQQRKIKPSICPTCKTPYEVVDLVVGTRKVQSGDPMVCSSCGSVLVVTDDMTVRLANTVDYDRWPAQLRRAIHDVVTQFHLAKTMRFH
jgi:hypothetical protein